MRAIQLALQFGSVRRNDRKENGVTGQVVDKYGIDE